MCIAQYIQKGGDFQLCGFESLLGGIRLSAPPPPPKKYSHPPGPRVFNKCNSVQLKQSYFLYNLVDLLEIDVYYLKIKTSIFKIFDINLAIKIQISILSGPTKQCILPKVKGQSISFQILKLYGASLNHKAQFVSKNRNKICWCFNIHCSKKVDSPQCPPPPKKKK